MKTLCLNFDTLYVKNHRPGFYCDYHYLYSKKAGGNAANIITIPFINLFIKKLIGKTSFYFDRLCSCIL